MNGYLKFSSIMLGLLIIICLLTAWLRRYKLSKLREPDKWVIKHPGTLEWIDIKDFMEGYSKWYEGFNPPRFVVEGKYMEDLKVSSDRVKEYDKKVHGWG